MRTCCGRSRRSRCPTSSRSDGRPRRGSGCWRRGSARWHCNFSPPAVPEPRTEPEARERSAAGSPDPHVQRDQPAGVPPLELTGSGRSRTCPPRTTGFGATWPCTNGLLRAWPAPGDVDMACGEGYGVDVLSRSAASVTGVDANPQAHEHAACYRAANVKFERALVESYAEPPTRSCSCRRSGRTPAVCSPTSARSWGPRAVSSLPSQCADARAKRGEPIGHNPWHVHEYRRAEFEQLCGAGSRASSSTGSHARRQATSWRGAAGGTACTPRSASASASTGASLPRISARDFVLARGGSGGSRAGARLPRGVPGVAAPVSRARWRSSCTPTCPTWRAFGTWPRRGVAAEVPICRCSDCSTRVHR